MRYVKAIRREKAKWIATKVTYSDAESVAELMALATNEDPMVDCLVVEVDDETNEEEILFCKTRSSVSLKVEEPCYCVHYDKRYSVPCHHCKGRGFLEHTYTGRRIKCPYCYGGGNERSFEHERWKVFGPIVVLDQKIYRGKSHICLLELDGRRYWESMWNCFATPEEAIAEFGYRCRREDSEKNRPKEDKYEDLLRKATLDRSDEIPWGIDIEKNCQQDLSVESKT